VENDPFCSFVDLVNFDQKMFKTRSSLQDLKKQIDTLHSQLATLNHNIEQKKQQLLSTKKEVDLIELQMKELDQLEKDKKLKLESVNNEKEYSSLKKEIERIKQSQHKLEPDLVIRWNKLNFEQEDYDAKKVEYLHKIEDLENQMSQVNTQIKQLDDEIVQYESERKTKEVGIPEEWLTKYNIMHTKVTNPVVTVEKNSCTACFHHLTNQDMMDLKLKKFIQCKSCYRLLYLETMKEQHCGKTT